MNRLLLTICCLLLLFFLGRQEQVPGAKPITTMAMATGFCSGDCVSCGCPPALAASNNCCCTRTRQLRHPELLPTIAVNAIPESTSPYPLSLRCTPCNRTPAVVTAVGVKLSLLTATALTVSPPTLILRTCFPTILLPLGRGNTAPPSPPPEIVI